MDIEQLKLILETVGSASEGAGTVAMMWIGQGYFSSLMTGFVVALVAFWISRVIGGLTFGGTLQSRIGMTPDGQLTRNEKERILSLLDDGIKYRTKGKQ